MRDECGFEKVRQFASAHLKIPEVNLRPETRVGEDLKVIGDDAAELLDGFSREFKVDMSGFQFEKHFPEDLGIRPLLYLFWARFNSKKLKFEPLTLADLARAACTGSWAAGEQEQG